MFVPMLMLLIASGSPTNGWAGDPAFASGQTPARTAGGRDAGQRPRSWAGEPWRRDPLPSRFVRPISAPPAIRDSTVPDDVSVRFSPGGGCTDEVVSVIAGARKSVRVLAYSFTSRPIADALIAAHRRGVDVAIIVDRSQKTARGSRLAKVAAAGIPCRVDSMHAIAHNKVVIADRKVVTTGSFNLTDAAERSNAENLATIRDASVAARFSDEWDRHATHSEPYAARAAAAPPAEIPAGRWVVDPHDSRFLLWGYDEPGTGRFLWVSRHLRAVYPGGP